MFLQEDEMVIFKFAINLIKINKPKKGDLAQSYTNRSMKQNLKLIQADMSLSI